MASANDVFLSHAWGPEDPPGSRAYPLKEKALCVARALEAAGVSVWVDTQNLAAAAATADLSDSLAAAIVKSRVVVICVSDEYARSCNCRLEAEFSKRRGKPLVFVNVGARGYEPSKFSDADVDVVGWLDFQILRNNLWADAREPVAAASASGHATAVTTVLAALGRGDAGGGSLGGAAASGSLLLTAAEGAAVIAAAQNLFRLPLPNAASSTAVLSKTARKLPEVATSTGGERGGSLVGAFGISSAAASLNSPSLRSKVTVPMSAFTTASPVTSDAIPAFGSIFGSFEGPGLFGGSVFSFTTPTPGPILAPAVASPAALSAAAEQALASLKVADVDARDFVRVLGECGKDAIMCKEVIKLLVEYTGGRGQEAERAAALIAAGATVDSRIAECVTAQIPSALFAAIQTHAGSRTTLFYFACTVIENIACKEAGLSAVLAAHGPTVLLAAMRANAESTDFASNGCRALLGIAIHPSGQQAVIAAGATSAIVATMTALKSSTRVAEYGSKALGVIARSSDEAAASAAIVAAMTTHNSVAAVAEQGCRALCNIAFLPTGKSAIISAGGRTAIEAAVARHAAAKESGNAALAALNS